MITPQRHRENAVLRMVCYHFSYGTVYLRHRSRILQNANGRVDQIIILLELVMSIEDNVPSESLELFNQACFYESDRPLVHASPVLHKAVSYNRPRYLM